MSCLTGLIHKYKFIFKLNKIEENASISVFLHNYADKTEFLVCVSSW